MGIQKAMVLAAGEGRRLRPLTARVAKPALPLMGRPLIDYVLRRLARSGIRDVVVNLHHLRHTLQPVLDEAPSELTIHRSVEEVLLGTAGGLKKVAPLLEDGPFVLVNGDTLVDFDLGSLEKVHRDSGAEATMLLRPRPAGSSFSGVEVDGQGRVRSIRRSRADDELMFGGVWILEPSVLERLSGMPAGLETELLPALIEDERVQSAVQYGSWMTIDTPARYWSACLAMARDQIFEEDWNVEAQPVSERGRERAFVATGASTRIRRGARFRGDVVLGARCSVGEGAELEGVVCWDRVKIPPGATLRHCIVTDGVQLPAEIELTDRLVMRVGDDASGLRRREIQDGLVIAQLRLGRGRGL